MATFRDGIEAAARLIESEFGDQYEIETRARSIRAIQEPSEMMSAIEEAFERFKAVYLGIGGFRNPSSASSKGWGASQKAFERLVKKQKHHPDAIISGTAAYAATRPDIQFVKAPEAFLHAEWFTKDWSRARNAIPATGNKSGATSLFDLVRR